MAYGNRLLTRYTPQELCQAVRTSFLLNNNFLGLTASHENKRYLSYYLKATVGGDVMQEIFIPSYRLVDLPKPHYVYLINILSRETGQQDLVERRYSAFHALHRELRKHFNTPSFPPKRIRCTQERVLEQRRKELEKYIQTMFRYVPTKPLVSNFLGLSDNIQSMGEDKQMNHRPIYLMGPSYNGCIKSSLPDIVVEGVADALYGPS